MNKTLEKTSFAALSAMPFVVAALVGATPLREAGLHVPVGAVAFALIAAAVFLLVRRSAAPWEDRRELITAGVLFIVPFSLFALLWVGMATPYHTTPAENLLRYEVLVIGAIAVSCAFLFLFRIVSKRGERYLATLFLGISMLAGAAYLTWHCFHAGMWLIRIKNDIVTPHVADMTAIFDAYIFFATILTFVATGLAAVSMARSNLLSSRASRVYLSLCVLGAVLIILRGVAYPGDPRTSSPAAYEIPGIIAGIPAIPWLMPCLLGVVLLRRSTEVSGPGVASSE